MVFNKNDIIGFFLFLVLTSCTLDSSKINKAKSITIGMSMREVKGILGMPIDSLTGYFDKNKIMYRYKLSYFSSDDIEVYFDSLSKVVTNIVLPKGEK